MQAKLPEDLVNTPVDMKSRMASGAFDIVTGDVERLSDRRPRPLREVLSATQ